MQCSWTIHVVDESSIVLIFTEFNTKAFDYLFIYEGYSPMGDLRGRFGGAGTLDGKLPSPIWSNEKDLFMTFNGDDGEQRNGFRVLLKTVGKCTRHIVCEKMPLMCKMLL